MQCIQVKKKQDDFMLKDTKTRSNTPIPAAILQSPPKIYLHTVRKSPVPNCVLCYVIPLIGEN